jgi:hypothetical protein
MTAQTAKPSVSAAEPTALPSSPSVPSSWTAIVGGPPFHERIGRPAASETISAKASPVFGELTKIVTNVILIGSLRFSFALFGLL